MLIRNPKIQFFVTMMLALSLSAHSSVVFASTLKPATPTSETNRGAKQGRFNTLSKLDLYKLPEGLTTQREKLREPLNLKVTRQIKKEVRLASLKPVTKPHLEQTTVESLDKNIEQIPAPLELPRFTPAGELKPLFDFVKDTLVPKEGIYFQTGIGIHPASGMPYDHRRYRLEKKILGEKGNYTAASKVGVLFPYLVGIIQEKPIFEKAPLRREEAEKILLNALKTIKKYIRDYPTYGGFLPWVDIRPNGSIAPANTKIPSLDNGQMTWSLASIVIAFENSESPAQRELAQLAAEIIEVQDYKMFYDEEKKMLFGTIQKDANSDDWMGDQSYYLQDMFEGTLAVLWGILHGQIPEDAWHNLKIPTIDYVMQNGEKVTTMEGFRASFHEHWALIYLPFMETSLRPLYENFLHIQTDFAQKKKIPGFLSTAYSPRGTYRQMGIPEIAAEEVDRNDVSVLFATAMAITIDPFTGGTWLKNFYEIEDVVTDFGAVESVGPDGYADIFTADAKGVTILSATGGVVDELTDYLKSRQVPGTGKSMYVKFNELLHSKYLQMLEGRAGEPVHYPAADADYALPPSELINFVAPKLPVVGETFNVNEHLQKGHLHGKNVRSLGLKTLEDDLGPGKRVAFDFEIPPYYPYFDQWAFRGTYINKAVGISNMKYVSMRIPVDAAPHLYEVELKSDGIVLATAMVNTTEPGIVKEGEKWKTLISRIQVIPDAEVKPLNYFAVAIHDPRYLHGEYTMYGREGTIEIEDIILHEKPPAFLTPGERIALEAEEASYHGFELINYWRVSHGDLRHTKNEYTGSFVFSGGAGWKGGYMPYTDLGKFRYLQIKVRNKSKECNRFFVELKNEGSQLLNFKVPVLMPVSKKWQVFEIALPEQDNVAKPLNYFAVSDPYRDFEVGSISLHNTLSEGYEFGEVTELKFERGHRMVSARNVPRCERAS